MLYSDGIHLISDIGIEDLHAQAQSMRIKKCWYHRGKSKKFPHYDIPKILRSTFFKQNPQVKQVSSKDLIKIIKNSQNKT